MPLGLPVAGLGTARRGAPAADQDTEERYAALEQAIRARHPYELPEIVAVRIERGLAAYLDWLAAETGATL